MNENKSKDNKKQTESNKDSPAVVTDFLLYFQKLYFWYILHIKDILKNNWQYIYISEWLSVNKYYFSAVTRKAALEMRLKDLRPKAINSQGGRRNR